MSLLGLQNVLARLYTDSAFRESFFANRALGGDGLALTAGERRQLLGLDRGQVERFARSLRSKRLGSVRSSLPGTARLLETFGGQFDAYSDVHPSAPAPVADAFAFADFLLARVSRDSFLAEVIACDRLRLELLQAAIETRAEGPVTLDSHLRLTAHAQVRTFAYDLSRWYPLAVRGEPVDPLPDPCSILLGKIRDEPVVKLRRINMPTAQLLTACDGHQPLGAIITAVADGLGLTPEERAQLAGECLALLASLHDSGLIVSGGQ